ncbi:hypothetical protein SDC9_129207 [bioreactor metagenome]|uniref:Uncharacterized protein n=1 Tax=bioreactor metagenome TaxID=1076179 RepID=A0A645CYB1_9ZZZZ
MPGDFRRAVEHQRALVAVDLHHFIAAAEPLPRTHQVADDAVGVSDHRSDVVGRFRLVAGQQQAVRVNPFRRAEEPVRQVDVVGQHIDDHAAAKPEIGEPVARHPAIEAERQVDVAVTRTADPSFFEQLLQHDGLLHMAADEADREELAVRLAAFKQYFRVFGGAAERLLAKNRFSGRHRRFDAFAMAVSRAGDDDAIDVGGCRKLGGGVADACAELLPERRGSLRPDIVNSGDVGVFKQFDLTGVAVSHAPRPDDSVTDHFFDSPLVVFPECFIPG